MLGAVLEALGLWALAFVPASVLTSAASGRGSGGGIAPAAASQLAFLLLSLAAAGLAGGVGQLGLTLDVGSSLRALAISLPAAAALSVPAARLSGGYEPPFVPRDLPSRLALALALAPAGEEVLFRGLLEGHILLRSPDPGSWISMAVAVAIPAVLFSLVHVIPFSDAPRGYLASVLSGALVLGLLAGYFRATSGSVFPAIAVHAAFNLVGVAAESLS